MREEKREWFEGTSRWRKKGVRVRKKERGVREKGQR